MPDDQIVVLNAPELPDLKFRHFYGEDDYGSLATVLTASSQADKIIREVTAENIKNAYEDLLSNCDPYTDMIIAEIAGEMIGYARGWWSDELPKTRLYQHNGFLLPKWRRKKIGLAMFAWTESRLKEIAISHPLEYEKYFQVVISQSEEGTAGLLEHWGYLPVRYFYQMVRPTLDNIVDFPLPDGVEIRTPTPADYRAIWNSIHETPEDEWGSIEPTEEANRDWQAHPDFQPHLWQIAWDTSTNTPIGHVLTFINHEENRQFDRKRGYTEGIGISRAWRRRGIAKALISLSLHAQKKAGMLESALVADVESTSGVTRLYESCGFHIVEQDTIYRKSLSFPNSLTAASRLS